MTTNCPPQDYVAAAYADAMVEGLDPEIVNQAYTDSIHAAEFFYRVQALVQLKEIVDDHYDRKA